MDWWHSVRVPDLRSMGSNPGLPTVECNPGQVVNTRMPLSPSSIIWYQPMCGDALHHQQTNTQCLQAGCPSCRPTKNVKCTERNISHSTDLPTTSSPAGVFQLCLWPLKAPGYLGGGLPCLSSALWCQHSTVVKLVLWSGGGLTWRNQVGADPIYPFQHQLIWRYLGIK